MTTMMSNPSTMNTLATGMQISGAVMQGVAGQDAAKYEAEMMRRRANQEYANMTQEAQRRKREGDRMMSNARAIMAGSGGVTTDAGATSALGDIASQRDYNVLAAMYQGEQAKQDWESKADARKYEGKVGMSNAISTSLSSAFSLFAKNAPNAKKWKDPGSHQGPPVFLMKDR